MVSVEPIYSVNVHEIITRLQHKVIADTSASKYGVDGRSLVQLFLSKGQWYEQSTLANLAIIRDRQASTLLYRLYKDDWVQFKDVSRRNDFSPQSTTYYWRADRQHIVNKILQQSYKAIGNLRLIRAEMIRTGGLCLDGPGANNNTGNNNIQTGSKGIHELGATSGVDSQSWGVLKNPPPSLTSPDSPRQRGGLTGAGKIGTGAVKVSPTAATGSATATANAKLKVLGTRMYTRNLEQYSAAILQYNMKQEVAMGVIERQGSYARAGNLITPGSRGRPNGKGNGGSVSSTCCRMLRQAPQLQRGTACGPRSPWPV